jgi:tetratricopeptide (TPR) repeat protein
MVFKRVSTDRLFRWVMLASLGALAGCAGSSNRSAYLEEYDRGHYEKASMSAIKVVRDPGAPDRDLARLTAGLSAHARGKKDEAMVWLRPLTTNKDAEIAGKALATLGLIAFEDGEHRTAAKSLSRAAGKLKSDDSARAAMFAGDSYLSLGSFDAARLQYRLALAAAENPKLKSEISSRLGSGFTLQLGAFANKSNAERITRRLAQDRTYASLGSPFVTQRNDNRGMMYLVQVGYFSSEQDAKAAQLRTGIGGIITFSKNKSLPG